MANKMKKIYFDYASTTPVFPEFFEAMKPYFLKKFGNSMSLHSLGQEAKIALQESREKIAEFISAKSREIIFTSSATESNNFALKGIAFSHRTKGNHIIISSVEHESLLATASFLEKNGFEITKIKVDKQGLLKAEDIEMSIRKNTVLVSVIHANNEIGTIQPVSEIGRICRSKGIIFHTDAAQSFGKIPINVNQMNVDLLTASSHKIYGPKGAAILYVREGIKIEPLLHGGGQENGLRSSTVNIPAIVGFAKAVDFCKDTMKEEFRRISRLKQKFTKEVLDKIQGSKINGSQDKCLPNIVNVSFKEVEGEALVIKLDLEGILISTGSACSSTSFEPSHVLLALGLNEREARNSVRFSFGRLTTEKDIDHLVNVLRKAVAELRKRK